MTLTIHCNDMLTQMAAMAILDYCNYAYCINENEDFEISTDNGAKEVELTTAEDVLKAHLNVWKINCTINKD